MTDALRVLLALICLAIPARAENRTDVDLELLLAADVSRSMTAVELEIQRRGYAEALTSPEVIGAIRGGVTGRIALSYMEWAGADDQRVIVPWTLIETGADAREFAARLTARFDDTLRRTSISEALIRAAKSIAANDFAGLRRVIDVSGDGPNNQGRPVLMARAAVLARGVIINGLPLMTQDALSMKWGIPDLDAYYARCVIGGPGSFMIPVWTWHGFVPAVRRKLVLEIAGRAPLPGPTARPLRHAAGHDCLIGEKIWQHYTRDRYSP